MADVLVKEVLMAEVEVVMQARQEDISLLAEVIEVQVFKM